MKKKYFITTSLLIFLSLLMFFIVSCLVVINSNKKSTKKEMQTYLQIIIDNLNVSELDTTANLLHSVNEEIRITFIDKDGHVLYDTDTVPEDNHLNRPEIKKLGTISYRYSDTLQKRMVYIAGFTNDIYVRVCIPEANTYEIVNSLLLYGFLFLVLIIFLSFFLIKRISNNLIKPIKEEVNKLSQIVGNDYKYIGDDLIILSNQIDQAHILIDNKINSLNEEKNKLNYIIQNMHQGLIIINGLGDVILINAMACSFLERNYDLVIDKSFYTLFSNHDISMKIEEAMNKMINAKLDYEKNNRYYSLNISSINDEYAKIDGKFGVSVFIIEVTNEKLLEKTKTDFFANASHELKSPLTSIIGYQQMIREGIITDEEEIKDATNKTIKEAERMNKIIIEMLELSKLEAKKEVEIKTQSIRKITNEVLVDLANLINDKNIKVDINDDDFLINMNSDDSYQLLKNIIENAVKYNLVDGSILISIDSTNREITVKDTGIGIPKEHLNRVFERFYRVDKAKSKALGGTGLGLAIVKHICNKYNISVSLNSEEKRGTVVKLIFKEE